MRPIRSLSVRLLVLTVAFVMLAEVLIFAPSVARFRLDWLNQRLAEAALAAQTIEAAPQGMVTKVLEARLLAEVGAHLIDLTQPGGRVYMLATPMPPDPVASFDLRLAGPASLIAEAFAALARTHSRVIRVAGAVPHDPAAVVVVVIDEAPMRDAMAAFSGRILALSIVISLFTAGLVYLSLHRLLVRPMRRITAGIAAFRRDPEDGAAVLIPSGRSDEIGIAERELAEMQAALQTALRQKTRLAALGTAVAMINHDLGNILATASLISERLARSEDPEVVGITPRLMDALDRAAALCRQTLSFCRDGVLPLHCAPVALRGLVAQVGTEVLATRRQGDRERMITWDNRVADNLTLCADPGQLSRALFNLGRNALQAGAGRVTVAADRRPGHLRVTVADDGPGLAPRARDHLFLPFVGTSRTGGTGLGLAIARDVVRAHGGDLKLVDSGPGGTIFALELPERALLAGPEPSPGRPGRDESG
jgi:signal transduction histidine kinase